MRILLVEDEEKLSRAIKRGLEQEGFAVDTALTGPAGLASARAEEYDSIILDRMLPGIGDGIELCGQLRSLGKTAPILMLTARDSLSDRVEGLNAGADDYLVKPFAFEELVARVRALLRRPTQVLGTVLQVGDLQLNPHGFEVRRDGKLIELTQTEFKLLEYLIRNQGRVVSKESIISHVWDFDADILPNTVEAFVGYLRAKIEKPFAGPPLIHTVRGFGYRLGGE